MRFVFSDSVINTDYPVFVIGFHDDMNTFQAYDVTKNGGEVAPEDLVAKRGRIYSIEFAPGGSIKTVSISSDPGYQIGRGEPGHIAFGNTIEQAKEMLHRNIRERHGVKSEPGR